MRYGHSCVRRERCVRCIVHTIIGNPTVQRHTGLLYPNIRVDVDGRRQFGGEISGRDYDDAIADVERVLVYRETVRDAVREPGIADGIPRKG